MNLQVDLSLNTVIITVAVGAVGFLVKEAVTVVCEKLIAQLIETAAATAITDKKIETLIDATGDVEKLRRDLNNCFVLYRELRTDFDKLKNK